MCRLVGWVSSRPVTLRTALGDRAIERLRSLATVHCHGWGAAWRDGEGIGLSRSPVGAAEDPGFVDLVDNVATTAGIVHLRLSTPGYGRTVVDNHPFRDGAWALMHNGAVAPVSGVDKLLHPTSTRRPEGSTDSERWFLALRDELDRGADVGSAVRSVVSAAQSVGLHASSWNSMLLGPDGLHVVVHNDPSLIPVDVTLWPDLVPDIARDWPPYFDVRMRVHQGVAVATSSGVVDDTSDWTLLPNRAVVRLEPGDAAPRVTSLARPEHTC
jgi:predicted glutamine amidotransferase